MSWLPHYFANLIVNHLYLLVSQSEIYGSSGHCDAWQTIRYRTNYNIYFLERLTVDNLRLYLLLFLPLDFPLKHIFFLCLLPLALRRWLRLLTDIKHLTIVDLLVRALREELVHEVEVVVVRVLLVVAVDQVQQLGLCHPEDVFEVVLQLLLYF